MGGSQSSPQSLDTCLSLTNATLIYPNASTYASVSEAQNVNYHYRPAVIAQPHSTAEVASIVRCVAAQNGTTKLSTRGGGHGYAAYALGGADGFVVIDSSNFATVDVNAPARTAKVGMGMDLGKLAKRIGDVGFALPHGTCPTVGVSGHALGGGWGYSSRKWGWLQDHIVGMEYVNVTGTIKQISNASTGTDGDVWWAMRGAGSNNFGVVTSFTFALETAPSQAVNYRYSFGMNADCINVLLALQDIGQKPVASGGLPPEFGGSLTLYGESGGNGDSCTVAGQHLASLASFRTSQTLFNASLAAHGVTNYTTTAKEFPSWVAALTDLMGNLTDSTWYLQYYAQSLMDDGAPRYTPISARNITAAITAVRGIPGWNWIGFDLNGPVSRTNTPSPVGDAALQVAGKRGSLFMSQIFYFGFPDFDHPAEQAAAYAKFDPIREAVKAAKPGGTWRSYVNYIDPRLQDWGTQYYGAGLGRLKALKQVVDPGAVFDFPQGLAHA